MNAPSFRLKSLHYGLLLWFGCSLSAHAAITLDGSMGPGGSLSGPNYAITADLGRQLGANLFHSFGTFNLGTGESATFSGPGSIAHIIGRVTGGGASTIDGLLRSTIPGASLYLINPNGLIFGSNAALDLGGSFYAGTANYIGLADGGRFDATTPVSSVLSAAPPTAFGFLSAPAPINLHGAGLTVAQGQNLSLIGGNITLDSAAWAWAPGGRVTLASGASSGEIGLSGSNSFANGGNISLRDGSQANVSGSGVGGSIVIRGGRLQLEGSYLVAETESQDGGSIDVAVTGDVGISSGGWITTSTSGAGRGGDVRVSAGGAITLSGRGSDGSYSAIRANTTGAGNGGHISLNSPVVVEIEQGAELSATTSCCGHGGDVSINTVELSVASGGIINASTFGAGEGGSIRVNATESVLIRGNRDAGTFSAIAVLTTGAGNGGDILLTTPLLVVDGGMVTASTYGQLESGSRNGNGGNIIARADQLAVINGGLIDSSSISSSGDGGSIDIEANHSILLSGAQSSLAAITTASGAGGSIFVLAPKITVEDSAFIAANTTAAGEGGFVLLEGSLLNLLRGGTVGAYSTGTGAGGHISVNMSDSITVSGQNEAGWWSGFRAGALGTGNGGNIVLTAPWIKLIDHGVIQATTGGELEDGARNGNGGNIRIRVDQLEVISGGLIDSSSVSGSGNGGNIDIEASHSILLSGAQSGLAANTLDSGASGSIFVLAPAITIKDSAALQALTTGAGNAGNIMIEAGGLSISNGGQIESSSRSGSSGNGGSILVQASDFIDITGHGAYPSAIFANTFGSGEGGHIYLNTGNLTVHGNAWLQAGTKGSGNGGFIMVDATNVAVQDGGSISAATFGAGKGGMITINAGSSLSLGNGAKIESRGDGSGDAGNILIQTSMFTSSQSQVTTEAASAGGGNIEINAKSMRLSGHSAISATVGGGYGDGGNVSLNAGGIAAVENSDITARADQGLGGRITINAQAFLRASDIDLDASSNVIGNEGVVEVNTPMLDISGSLVILPSSYLNISRLWNTPCLGTQSSKVSSFVVRGRGGMPVQPDSLLPASMESVTLTRD